MNNVKMADKIAVKMLSDYRFNNSNVSEIVLDENEQMLLGSNEFEKFEMYADGDNGTFIQSQRSYTTFLYFDSNFGVYGCSYNQPRQDTELKSVKFGCFKLNNGSWDFETNKEIGIFGNYEMKAPTLRMAQILFFNHYKELPNLQ